MTDVGTTGPWLTLIGLGEDGLDGLTGASRDALAEAQIVFGAPRHLDLAKISVGKARTWPVPFSTAPLLAHRGTPVVALVSSDPFWFGAGGSLMRDLAAGEWVAHPALSTFQRVASHLGWRIEHLACRGLHAAPFTRLLPDLAPGARVIATLRDGAAGGDLAAWLTGQGYGASQMHLCEAMGGPRQRVRTTLAEAYDLTDVASPVAVALDLDGPPLPVLPGRGTDSFAQDGQISKPQARALTLMALSPYAGAHLWDLGAGSGAISVEWCRAAPGATATAVEAKSSRIPNIRANADAFGVEDRLTVLEGQTPGTLPEAPPNAVFVGGGASANLIAQLWDILPLGCVLVVNAVTLETEALVMAEHAARGGTLTRIEVSEAAPLGRFRGWDAARPLVQWRVVR